VFRPAAAVLLVLSGGIIVAAQAIVPVGDEPHHKRALYTANVRLFEILVPAGAVTLDHSHDRDVAVVAIGDTTIRTRTVGKDWDPPRSYVPGGINLVTYTGASSAHRMENVGQTPYRVVAVENTREGGWTMPRILAAPGTTLTQESRAFAVYDIRLDSGTPRTSHVHQQPTVVVLIAGNVMVQGGGGESEFRIETPGRWFPSSWEYPHTLSLIGAANARLIEVEAR
jgi:hypothetical protein